MASLQDALAPLARLIITWLSRRSLPRTSGRLQLTGLTAPVEVLRDRWGVPHIYAQNLADLIFAQGFIHAQDRLWQMEMNRRIAQGTLSEIFGEIALDTDRTVRTFGFNRLGRQDWANADSDTQALLLAYTAGVNAFINHPSTRLPVEFSLLRFRPRPWQPEDSTAFARVMIWQLSHAWNGELVKARILQKVGEEAMDELEIRYPAINPLILPEGIEFNLLADSGGSSPMSLERGLGSNAWAVSGGRTTSGAPLLCNDMHLAVSIPGLWYEAHLVAGDFQVTGAGLAGLPLVQVGHNAHIAWGMTLAFSDCEDLFIEKFDAHNQYRYLFRGDWQEAEVIEENIPVKGRSKPHIEPVVITHHGPIISSVVGEGNHQLAVNSMALRPSKALSGWLALNKAGNWEEFRHAMSMIEAPQLSVAYADVAGNIGYWMTGTVPLRAKGDGSLPVPGWTGEYEWVGEVPFAEMPQALNPQQEYLVTCNNRAVGDDYPHFLGNFWMSGYRARRLSQMIEAGGKISISDCCNMHMDVTSLPGLELRAHLAGFSSQDPDVLLALELLQAWDGRLTPESVGGTVYEVARYTLVRNLLEPGLGQELSWQLMGRGFHPLLKSANEFYGQDTVVLLRLVNNPQSWWLQQAGGKDALIDHSLKQTVNWLKQELGEQVRNWQWGKLHKIVFAHPLGLQKPLDKVFNRGPYPIGGDTDTPCQTAMAPHEPYDNRFYSPSFRQIVDLGDLSRSLAIIPPGQSGHIASPHYSDLIEPWLRGEYHPQLWRRAQVEKEAVERLELE